MGEAKVLNNIGTLRALSTARSTYKLKKAKLKRMKEPPPFGKEELRSLLKQ